jgi:Ser/Thr protein kinase RdoA (MazF antagonist)
LTRLQLLAEKALLRYYLRAAQCVLLQYEDNAVFHITTHTGEQFVLRVNAAEGQSAAEQRSEMQWLTALRQETNLVVPEPVSNIDGSLVTTATISEVPEPRHCVLLRWIPGDPPTSAIPPEVIERIGAFTAHLHRHAEHFPFPAEFVRPSWDWERLFGAFSTQDRDMAKNRT